MDGAKRVPDPLGRPEPIDDRTAGEILGDVASDFVVEQDGFDGDGGVGADS